ncbi:acyltransferase family protein, partial [Thermosulfuriphilus sp.]
MKTPDLSRQDSEFLRYLRGLAIFIVVFGHVGGFWFYRPYSGFLLVSVPIFFMISGAVSYPSYRRSGPLSFYLAKRTISLLIPYYLLCLLCLGFYLLQEGRLPSFSAERLIRWLLIRPSKEMMPFPIGQIWFLYVLLIISFLSPLYFFLWKRFPRVLGLICLLFLMLSLLQHFSDISQNFHLLFFDFF